MSPNPYAIARYREISPLNLSQTFRCKKCQCDKPLQGRTQIKRAGSWRKDWICAGCITNEKGHSVAAE